MSNNYAIEKFFDFFAFFLLTTANKGCNMFSTVEIPNKNQGVTKMKITRKEVKITEREINDMLAEKLLEKYYNKKYGNDGGIEEYLSLAVWVGKDTGVDHLYDIARFEDYAECKEDDETNKSTFNYRQNCYILFITGKRVTFLKDKPIYVVIEAEAIER